MSFDFKLVAGEVYRRPDNTLRVALKCKDPSRAKQSEFKGSDIHEIIKRFDATGVMPSTGREGLYIDVSQVGDYREAVDLVRNAERFFSQLPAAVRTRFNNDAAEYLDFVSDATNYVEAQKLGLVPSDNDEGDGGAVPPLSDGTAPPLPNAP